MEGDISWLCAKSATKKWFLEIKSATPIGKQEEFGNPMLRK